MLVDVKFPPAPSAGRLGIGDWTVEPALNQLSAAGRIVKLEPKAMEVLVYLAHRPGQVVSREELLSALWPEVVVGDDALTQVVVKLRKALGDTSEESAYIQTIAKRGYRLIASVPAEGTEGARIERKSRLQLLAAAGAVVLALATAAAWWTTRSEPAIAPAVPTAAQTDKPTIAIRPFEALGRDAEAAVLARGITEDLATDLSKALEVRVAPPARYLVSGTVERSDARLRVHAHLADAQTGKQLWSERFDRARADFFAIEDELAPKIAQKLSASVSKTEFERMARRHTRNLEAYEYFQRGQVILQAHHEGDNVEAARDLFWRAIKLDANFARAYSGLAMSYVLQYRWHQPKESAAALARALELARTAHQINPDIPETYWILAFVYEHGRQYEQAMQHIQTALKLNPSYADGYALLGSLYTYIGRPAETVPLARTALRLNPEAGQLYFLVLGRAYLFLGDFEQARVNLDEAVKRNPGTVEPRVYLAAVHLANGDEAAAGWEAEEIRAIHPGFSGRLWLEVNPMLDANQKAKLERTLAGLGL